MPDRYGLGRDREEFGIFGHIEDPPGTPTSQLFRDRLTLIKMADKAGFGGYHLAEHQGSELCMAPGQELFIAAASQVTSDIKLGTMVKLLPIHRPVRLIEDMCTVDQLTDGRLEYGVGRGGSRSSTTGSARTGGSPRPVHRCAGDHQARVQRRRNLQRAQPFYDFPTMPLSTKPLQE